MLSPQRNTCRTCTIRPRALCSALSTAALDQINRVSRRRRIAPGRAIFNDEDVNVVATILSGVAKSSVSLPDGRTQVVGLHFPADFVGRPFAGQAGPLVEAATEVELCCFERTRFEGLLQEHRSLEEFFVRRMTNELDAAREWMLLLGHKSAEERVASFILLCLHRLTGRDCRDDDDTSEPVRLDLPLSRAEMAQYLGMTIETVSRMLKRLSIDGIVAIGTGRGLTVLDAAELTRRAERSVP